MTVSIYTSQYMGYTAIDCDQFSVASDYGTAIPFGPGELSCVLMAADVDIPVIENAIEAASCECGDTDLWPQRESRFGDPERRGPD
jgi:hypothetical protein